jgi:hypothetical protein
MSGRKTLKQILMSLLSGMLFLTACGQSSSAIQTAPVPVVDNVTLTRSPIPTNTNTSVPTETSTATITSLPAIPTFTPTFDVSTIVTVTPAPKAECPKIDNTIKPENYLPKKLEYPSPGAPDKILEFLNNGGNGQALTRRLDQIYSKVEYSGGYAFLDVTGDQISEFLYVELYYGERPNVFSCKNGKYEILAILSGQHDFDFYEMEFEDLNSDGIPEIIVTGTGGVSFPVSTIYLYEWNGRTFSILGQVSILALRQTQIKDIDGNGTKEILLIGDNPGCLSCKNFIPQRQRMISYSWNGKNFVEVSNEFESPEYRFQAIQDADAAVIVGKYDKAIQLYKKAISNKKLEWWSPERMQYKQETYVWFPGVTPPPIPSEDKTEYPRLAAYAYYRIMLLHMVQGNETDAGSVFNSLQGKIGDDPYGQPYFEMATAFWNAYQSTHKMYDGCAEAIQYAAEHPEILIPLGSDYHGSQSHIYVPADVCPFR